MRFKNHVVMHYIWVNINIIMLDIIVLLNNANLVIINLSYT